jgi:hypothetical protein
VCIWGVCGGSWCQLVQDPVARAFETWFAIRKSHCPRLSQECPEVEAFEEIVVAEASSNKTQDGCFFDNKVLAPHHTPPIL